MKKYILSSFIAFIFHSCITDVIDYKEVKIEYKDIETLVNGKDLSRYSTVKDTIGLPIVAWNGIPQRNTNIERFQELKDAGFNLQWSAYSSLEKQLEALNIAKDVGVKIFINCPELKNDTEKTVKTVMNHPANAGYFIQDEPPLEDIERCEKLVKAIRNIDSTKVCYINFHPRHGSFSKSGSSYTEYIHQFITRIPLSIISFDFYPITGTIIRYGWYDNLETIRKSAIDSGKPFWAFALSSSHWDYPIPTKEHLRLQVYSNLAYGAKGIQYFTYWIPDKDFYISAPIDRNGNKTTEYYLIKEMNNEINRLSHIFLTSNVIRVSHYGYIPDGTHPLNTFPFFIESINITGNSAIVSELRNKNHHFLMIQNNDLRNPIGIDIKTDTYTNIVLKNGKIVPVSLIGSKFKINSGDIAIFMRNILTENL